jgi:hypothetical protein
VKVWPLDPLEQATAPPVDQTAQKEIVDPPAELQYLLYLPARPAGRGVACNLLAALAYLR